MMLSRQTYRWLFPTIGVLVLAVTVTGVYWIQTIPREKGTSRNVSARKTQSERDKWVKGHDPTKRQHEQEEDGEGEWLNADPRGALERSPEWIKQKRHLTGKDKSGDDESGTLHERGKALGHISTESANKDGSGGQSNEANPDKAASSDTEENRAHPENSELSSRYKRALRLQLEQKYFMGEGSPSPLNLNIESSRIGGRKKKVPQWVEWRATLGTPKGDSVSWFGRRDNGQYLLIAQGNGSSWVAHIDADGNVLRTVNTGRRLAGIEDADTTPDGGVIVTSETWGRILWKLNAFYEPEWVFAPVTLQNCFFQGYQVYAAKDGTYVLNTAHAFHGIEVTKYPAKTLPDKTMWQNHCAMVQPFPEDHINSAISLFETHAGDFLTTYGHTGKAWLKRIKLSGGTAWERELSRKYRILTDNKYGEVFLVADYTSPCQLVKISADGNKKVFQRDTFDIQSAVRNGDGGIVAVGKTKPSDRGNTLSEGESGILIRAFNRQGEPTWGHMLQKNEGEAGDDGIRINGIREILRMADGGYLLAGTMDTKRREKEACVMKIEAPE